MLHGALDKRSCLARDSLRVLRLICLTSFVFTACAPEAWAQLTPKILRLPYVNDLAWNAARSRIVATAAKNILIINPETTEVEDQFSLDQIAGRIAVSD